MPEQPEGKPGGGIFIDPAVSSPQARDYASQIQNRRRPAAPMPAAYATPVGGAPMPTIPRLDGPHLEGRTMASQAMPQMPSGAPSIIEPPTQFGSVPASMGLLPSDMLPPAAAQDPEFIQGQGAMYASSQPRLAMKYGVIRNGAAIPPQQLSPGRRRSPDEAAADVQRFLAAQKQGENRAGEAAVEQASAQGLGGAAARMANPPGVEGVQPIAGDEKERIKSIEKELQKLDDFDFNQLKNAMMKDLLNNEEQKKILEERLEPLDLTKLIMEGRIYQTIPIQPGIFEPVFQSMGGQEDLALKRLIMNEDESLPKASNQYLLDKFSLMSVAAGLYAINKQVLPTQYDKEGNFDDGLFWTKFNRVVKFPYHMLASIGVHYYWFDVRVRKLFVAERIKNG